MRLLVQLSSLAILLFGVLIACKSKEIEVTEAPVDTVEAERLLGQLLFHERRLSKDNTVSCAACHVSELAFTDGVAFSDGIEGRKAARNSPTLFNLKDFDVFMFDGVIESLEIQALSPIQDHNEMGSSIKEILGKLKEDKVYKQQVHRAYGRDLDAKAITTSLAAFQRTLVSINSRYDLHLKDQNKHPFTPDETAGRTLFMETFDCKSCHSAPHFSNGKPESNGIQLTDSDWGRYRATGKIDDKGKFKVPSLRNIALTAPYMHDGRFATLEEVISFYAHKKETHGAPLVHTYTITTKQQAQLVAFLKTLTDTQFVAH